MRQLQPSSPPLLGTIDVDTTVQLVVGYSKQRVSLVLNNVGTIPVVIGNSSDLLTVTGFTLAPNQSLATDNEWAWYVIAGSSGGLLSYMDSRE